MNVDIDKLTQQDMEYSSFSSIVPESNLKHSSSTTPLYTPPSLLKNNSNQKRISSIEQFNFKSVPTHTLPTSSGLTTISILSNDTTSALIKQPEYNNNNNSNSNSNSNNNNNNNNKEENIMLESLTTPTTTEGSFTLQDNISNNNNDNNNKIENNNRQQKQSNNMNKKEIHHIPSIYNKNNNSNKKQQKQRNYELFQGKSTFFCGGRLMTSQAYWAFIIALILLITPCVLFAVFVCPFLWLYLHPIIPILFAYVFVLAIVSMFKASWTDPGVIPRGLDPTPTLETFDDHSSIWTQPFPADKCVKIKDEMWNLKYCDTCKIYRPPRASHCRQCDNCVENEDHHCIWLNNCIGKRNYRPFFTFILSSTFLATFVVVFSLIHMIMAAYQIQPILSFDLIFQTTPVSFILAIIGFILLWMVGGLTCYHCYLVVKGLTTHEKLRASILYPNHHGKTNPFNRKNPWLNVIQVLCHPQPKSHLRRRKYTDTENE
ncbi:unnamed protein product [Cunninghamella echinulata]